MFTEAFIEAHVRTESVGVVLDAAFPVVVAWHWAHSVDAASFRLAVPCSLLLSHYFQWRSKKNPSIRRRVAGVCNE